MESKKRGLGKRGQITIFIIIGILLLMASATYIYVKTRVLEEELPIEITRIEKIPLELEPIRTYVEKCLVDTATDAVIELGKHGGWVDASRFSTNPINPTEADAIDLNGAVIPYWYYLESRNDCEGDCVLSTNNIPDLKSPRQTGASRIDDSIETQIDEYINDNLKGCINGFTTFIEQGFSIRETGNIVATTTIRDDDITVAAEYPLEVSKGDVSSKVSKFNSNIDIDLKSIHDLAVEAINKERSYNYLEVQSRNLISILSVPLDEKNLPPISKIEYGRDTLHWLKSDAEQKLETALVSYVPIMQADQVNNYNRLFFDDQLTQSLFDRMIFTLDDYYDLSMDFLYLKWPIYLDITPSQGELISPIPTTSSLMDILGGLGIQQYEFAYDLSYPVLAEIYDADALNGKGYRFYFALESNLRNNKAIDESFEPIHAEVASRTMVCDLDMRNSGNITVKVTDAVTDDPIENVNIMYSFGKEACVIGLTDENGTLISRFPSGMGILSLSEPDHYDYAELYSTGENISDELNIELQPYRNISITVKKKMVEKDDGEWEYTGAVQDLNEDEQAFVTLTRIKENAAEEDFTQAIVINGTNEEETTLIPGKYEVSINSILNESIKIPEEPICVLPIIICWDYEDIPEIVLDIFPSSYLEFSNKTQYFYVHQDTLDESELITFYSIAPDIPGLDEDDRKHKDLEQLDTNKTIVYINDNWKDLQPEFS